ncbi:MAG TPA: hypothetical protein VFQ85_00105 [Mycobacteriales bacterium]|jgi:hypothetical protein|nr:hypothetical protein [Mycobacteriales bacterium]
MRPTSALAAASAACALVALAPGSAAAAVRPSRVELRTCDLDATDGFDSCTVILDRNPAGEVGVETWSGWGSLDIACEVSGFHWHAEGTYGYEWTTFPHVADVCHVEVQAIDGHTTGYVI